MASKKSGKNETRRTISLEDGEYEVEAIVDKGVLTPKERKKHNVDYKILYCVKFLNYEEYRRIEIVCPGKKTAQRTHILVETKENVWLPPESLSNVKNLIKEYESEHKNENTYNLRFDLGNLK